MNLWRSLAGMVEVEITCADPENLLNKLNVEKIPVFHICRIDDLTLSVQIERIHFEKLQNLLNLLGAKHILKARSGLYWSMKAMSKRPLFLAGLICFFLFLCFLPTRIWFVRVAGNQRIPTKKIIASAQESGICFGVSARDIRSEQIKNSLLTLIPELEWAGVNTNGCLAVISVREKTKTEENGNKYCVSSIIAARDGIIESCTATAGNLLCAPGQVVKQGQVLISGYTDCGIYLQAKRAQGEIYAMTKHTFQGVSLCEGRSRICQTRRKRNFSLILGKKRINLWKGSGIWDTTCGRMYEEYYITLPGEFILPLALAVETYTFWETAEERFSELPMSEFAWNTLSGKMIAGEILDARESSRMEEGVQHFSGTYVCREMIGREKQEQMGEYYVENH